MSTIIPLDQVKITPQVFKALESLIYHFDHTHEFLERHNLLELTIGQLQTKMSGSYGCVKYDIDRISQLEFDDCGNVTKATDWVGHWYEFEYDVDNNIIYENNDRNLWYRSEFKHGKLVREWSFDGRETRYTYNEKGDKIRRESLKNYVTESVTTYEWSYYKNRTVRVEKSPWDTITTTYNNDRQKTKVTYGFSGAIQRYRYNENKQLLTMRTNNGSFETRKYDDQGRILSIREDGCDSDIYGRFYKYNENGQLCEYKIDFFDEEEGRIKKTYAVEYWPNGQLKQFGDLSVEI